MSDPADFRGRPAPEQELCPIDAFERALVSLVRTIGHGALELARFADGVAERLDDSNEATARDGAARLRR